MSRLNIGGDKDDVFYRYKMDPIQSKIEGSGNGIKTVMPNLIEVGKALHRPPMYVCKYFGSELGAQTKHDAKNDRFIINGVHEAPKLQELLYGFIDKFVLCGSCGNPETNFKITNGKIERLCLACGASTSVDMRHKLTTYIVNHPPEDAVVIGGKKKGKKGKANKSKDQTPQISDHENGMDQSGDELHQHIMSEAKNLGQSKLQDDDWSVDMSEAAKSKRQAELVQGVEQLVLDKKPRKAKKSSKKAKKVSSSAGEEDDEDDPLDRLAEYIQTYPNANTREIVGEIREAGIPYHLASHVLAQVLIDVNSLSKDMKYRADLFKALNLDNPRAQKYFMGGIERNMGTHVGDVDVLNKKVPVALKLVYELDLVDESVILQWGAKPTKRWIGSKSQSALVVKAAEPFIEWLKEADESEEGESEDSE